MKLLAVICLVILTFSGTHRPAQATIEATFNGGSFEQAWRLGKGKQRAFFRFSTSMGKYVIRHDGLGEVASRRRGTLFHLKLGMAGRIERVYFYEYQDDLLMLYEVSDGREVLGYVVRLDQLTRKTRWVTPIDQRNIGPCPIDEGAAYCGPADDLTKIDLRTGHVSRQVSRTSA